MATNSYDKPAQNASPGWWDQGQVDNWFHTLLGRPEVNPDETYLGTTTGGHYGMEFKPLGSMQKVYDTIYNSQEGNAYRDSQKQAPPTQQAAPASSPVTPDGLPNAATQFATTYTQQAQQYPQTFAQERERVPLYQGYQYNVNTPTWQQPDQSGTESGMQALINQMLANPNSLHNLGPTPQFAAPAPGTENATQALVNQLLANPHTLNDQSVGAMKEKQKEDALMMMQQRLDPMRHDAAMRGVNGAPLEQQANQDFMESLLGSYRDIDLAKTAQDRQDELGAIAAGNQFTEGQFGRSNQTFANQLAAQQAEQSRLTQGRNDELNALGAGSSFLSDQLARATQGFTNQLGASQFDLSRQQAEQQDALAKWQSQAAATGDWNSNALNLAQLSGQSLSQQLAMQEYLENMRQFNATQHNNLSTQQFLANLFKGIGGSN